MDATFKPTGMYLRRLLEQIPGINDVFEITLNSYLSSNIKFSAILFAILMLAK